MNQTHPNGTSRSFRNIAELITSLEADNLHHPITRGTVAYLRILESEGPGEMLEAIDASLSASIAAVGAVAPTTWEAAELMEAMMAKVLRIWVREGDKVAGERAARVKAASAMESP